MFNLTQLSVQKARKSGRYREAGLIAKADLEDAHAIIGECATKKIRVYSEISNRVYGYPCYRDEIGVIEPIAEYTGGIPLEVVDAIIAAGIPRNMLSIITLRQRSIADPILVLRFYSGVVRRSDGEYHNMKYHFELVRWE